jgi:hypothetical protein
VKEIGQMSEDTKKNKTKRRFDCLIDVEMIIGEGVGTSNFKTTTGHFFQNVEIVFLVHHYYNITTLKLTKITTTKVFDHYYKNQNVKKNEKNIESLSFVLF